MKRISTIFLLTLFVFSIHGSATAQTNDPIEAIRQHYSEINRRVPNYRKVKKELSGFSAEGGDLVAYFHGPTVMKIAATFLGESGKSTEEYYYWDGRLIFVFRKESHYDQPLSGKVVTTAENRFYFSGGKLIRWIDENGKEVGANSTEYAGKQNEYLKSSKEFVGGAKSKNPTIESGQ